MAKKRTVRPVVTRHIGFEDFTLEDLESVRLALHGRSVIDWHRLDFSDHAEVDRFLRVNEFDPNDAGEMNRLEELRHDAVDYLTRTFNFLIPPEVAEGVPARDLLLMASRRGPHRTWACVVLKVMHIIHHLAGRELMVRLPISDDAVFRAVELKVMEVVEELRAAGYPIAEFQWSRKPRDSLITKLLAKRSTLAAKIYDKLRFRLIVPNCGDLVPMLAVLTRQLIPFNYVIPGASINRLVPFDSFEDMVSAHPAVRSLRNQSDQEWDSAMHLDPPSEDFSLHGVDPPSEDLEPLSDFLDTPSAEFGARTNEFSGSDYQIVNFVVDLPIRVSSILPPEQIPPDGGHVVFVLCEFQLADKGSAQRNEMGDSSHEAYKARQHRKVRKRLLIGTSGQRSATSSPTGKKAE